MCSSHHITTRLAVAGLAASLLLTACGKRNTAASTPSRDGNAVTRSAPAQPESPRSVYEEAAVDLQSLFDKLATAPAEPAPDAPPAFATRTSPTPAKPKPEPAAPVVAAQPPPTPPPAPKPEPTRQQKRMQYARQLAELLVPEDSEQQSPLRAVLPLIAIETIQPGVATAELNRLMATLNDKERQTVATVQALMSQFAAQADTGADPAALAAAIRSEVDRAQPAPPPPEPMLALGNVALCRKVEAFGRFTPYPGSSFVAGRRIPMIVYTEVENYVQARLGDLPSAGVARGSADAWALELSQEIHLYSTDGTLCWFVKEQSHRDLSQSRRRDFFLVQRVDLPATLSIGRYTLKIIVRDKAAAALKPDAEPVAEVNIPISIVADHVAANSDTKRPIATGSGTATASAPDR